MMYKLKRIAVLFVRAWWLFHIKIRLTNNPEKLVKYYNEALEMEKEMDGL